MLVGSEGQPMLVSKINKKNKPQNQTRTYQSCTIKSTSNYPCASMQRTQNVFSPKTSKPTTTTIILLPKGIHFTRNRNETFSSRAYKCYCLLHMIIKSLLIKNCLQSEQQWAFSLLDLRMISLTTPSQYKCYQDR